MLHLIPGGVGIHSIPQPRASPLNTAGFCQWKDKENRCAKKKDAIQSYEDNKEDYYELFKNPNP